MNIRHCLFWFENDMVTAILQKKDGLTLMKIKGKTTVPFTEAYWNEWIRHSGFCSYDKTDFCLIYDSEPVVAEKLENAQCEPSDSIWNRGKIQKAVEMLDIASPTVLYTENGALLCKTGSFRNKSDKCTARTASFINSENESKPIERKPSEATPFVQYCVGELKKFKENRSK